MEKRSMWKYSIYCYVRVWVNISCYSWGRKRKVLSIFNNPKVFLSVYFLHTSRQKRLSLRIPHFSSAVGHTSFEDFYPNVVPFFFISAILVSQQGSAASKVFWGFPVFSWGFSFFNFFFFFFFWVCKDKERKSSWKKLLLRKSECRLLVTMLWIFL